jgi:uncharacterized protein (TIGR03435 family)
MCHDPALGNVISDMTCQRRPVAATIALLTLTASFAFGQSNRLEFEVASIKPATPPNPMAGKMAIRIGMRVDAGRMEYTFGSLRDLIRTAFRVKDYQIQGPEWLNDSRFDIVAKLPDGASTDQAPEMLQALLADRFKLRLHHETKEHAVYALVPGKNGPKLTASDPDDKNDQFTFQAPGGPKAAAESRAVTSWSVGGAGSDAGPKPAAAGGMSMQMGPAGVSMNAKKMTLTGFADMLSRFVDKPVVNMTEIPGIYDFTLEMGTDQLMQMKGAVVRLGAAVGDAAHGPSSGPADAASDSGGGTIFQSVQKYGLKLDSRKAPMDTLVVDRIEKTPTEN